MNIPKLLALLLVLPLAAAAAQFEGIVTHVTDGDTLWVRPAAGGEAVDIRLEGIDAPEICQQHGRAARDALAALALHHPVRVQTRARDKYHRVIARVSVGHEDAGAYMVRHGYAWSYRFRGRGGPYQEVEALARQRRAGLWASAAAEEPRVFRKRHGSCHVPGGRGSIPAW